jgi:Esterase-like activity of phytase
VALSEDELLAMERGFQADVGNTIWIYRVSLKGAKDVSNVKDLAASNVEPMQKELLVATAGAAPP